MRIVCQQMILVKYHALFVIFEKAAKFEIVVKIIDGALRVKPKLDGTCKFRRTNTKNGGGDSG